jgi:hypothetical protein
MDSVDEKEVAGVGGVADAAPVDWPLVRRLTVEQAHVGWKSFRKHGDQTSLGLEVFISPNGHWYKWTEKGVEPDIIVPILSLGTERGLTCIDHWRPTDGPTELS